MTSCIICRLSALGMAWVAGRRASAGEWALVGLCALLVVVLLAKTRDE